MRPQGTPPAARRLLRGSTGEPTVTATMTASTAGTVGSSHAQLHAPCAWSPAPTPCRIPAQPGRQPPQYMGCATCPPPPECPPPQHCSDWGWAHGQQAAGVVRQCASLGAPAALCRRLCIQHEHSGLVPRPGWSSQASSLRAGPQGAPDQALWLGDSGRPLCLPPHLLSSDHPSGVHFFLVLGQWHS